jgi:hypothetical protein
MAPVATVQTLPGSQPIYRPLGRALPRPLGSLPRQGALRRPSSPGPPQPSVSAATGARASPTSGAPPAASTAMPRAGSRADTPSPRGLLSRWLHHREAYHPEVESLPSWRADAWQDRLLDRTTTSRRKVRFVIHQPHPAIHVHDSPAGIFRGAHGREYYCARRRVKRVHVSRGILTMAWVGAFARDR